MNTAARTLIVSVALSVLAGCVARPGDDEALGDAESAMTSTNSLSFNSLSFNSLSFNSLSFNSLSFNSLSFNSLSFNSLSFNSLSFNSLAAIQDPSPTGDLSRQLLKYTVSCALKAGHSLSFSWTDSQGTPHNETYAGSLGIAPEWATGALTSEASQRMVSSCLAARTNWYGAAVDVSLRADFKPIEQNTTDAELAAYPYVEGAFWGNLFTSSPYLNSCYTADNVAHSRGAARDCAAGHVNADGTIASCGMIHVAGSCDDLCHVFEDAEGLYLGCIDQPGGGNNGRTRRVITVGLQ